MLRRNIVLLLPLVILLFALSSCNRKGDGPDASGGGGQSATSDFKQENKADNLKALFHELHKATSGNDAKRAAALTRGLLPDESRIKKALRDDVPADTIKQIIALLQGLPTSDEKSLARVFAADPANTEVQVHGATTEEISSYAPGSAAYNEFPGATQRLANQVLRPNMTFYEVELLKPGNDAGMKYHLFFWDGTQWTMLGPIWRALR